MLNTKFTSIINKQNEDSGSKDIIEKNKSSGYFLVLSVFLLLLAFFIILNVISTRTEVKSQAVMNSILSTFRTTEKNDHLAKALVSRLSVTPQPEELVGEMRRLWLTAVPVTKLEVFANGRAMHLRLPASSIFPGGRSILRKDRMGLLDNLAQLLALEAQGFSNELELLIGTDWRLGEKLDLRENNLEIARALEFVGVLIKNGAPRDTISIGIREGDESELAFRFFVRSKAGGRVEFQQFPE